MKRMDRKLALASLAASLAAVMALPAGALAAQTGATTSKHAMTKPAERTLKGKLTIKNAAARTFTLGGMHRIYKAPVGTDLKALDGKTVDLKLASSGKVTSVTAASTVVSHAPTATMGSGKTGGAMGKPN
jgi:hypothetical protein